MPSLRFSGENMNEIDNKLKPKFFFVTNTEGEETFHQKDLVQLFPFGISISDDINRPFLLLKDEKHEHTLPVSIAPIEAGVTLSQNNKAKAPVTPHRFTELLLQSLNIKILQCVFVEIKGNSQYVRLYMAGHPYTNSIKLKADEAMSLCLQLDIPIFASKKFISKSKILGSELEGVKQGLNVNPNLLTNNHPYIM